MAVIRWSPGLNKLAVNDAVPLLSGICARATTPSVKVTIPVGAGEPPVTVAVKVAGCPRVEGLGELLAVVVEEKA